MFPITVSNCLRLSRPRCLGRPRRHSRFHLATGFGGGLRIGPAASLLVALLLFLVALLLPAGPTLAAPGDISADRVWREVTDGVVPTGFGSPGETIGSWRTFEFTADAFSQVVLKAPDEYAGPAAASETILSLPMPDGSYQRFRIVSSPILSPELEARMPEVSTFLAQGLDDPLASGRFDITPLGFHALILVPGDAVFIQPYRVGETRYHVSYRNSDVIRQAGDFTCGTLEELKNLQVPVPMAPPSGSQLRTYRIGISATGEYSQFFGGVPGAQAQIASTINALNALYEAEVSIRFTLVCISAYPDPTTDPFPTPETAQDGTLNQQNQDNLDAVCGADAYDVGQVFHRRASGYLGQALGDACTANKGKGDMTGVNPTSAIFLIDGLAHEMGHQFTAAHSYNGSDAGCSQRSGGDAYEIGSGSTIMSYAIAGCTEDIPGSADPYFHTHSFDQMTDWREGGGNCGTASATGNTPPNVSAGADYTIPRGTPFTLTGSGNDPDGDPLTFCWEQYDLGDATPPFNPNNGPLFRSKPPVGSPSRTFPPLTDIVNGNPTPFEILPTVDRTLHFRLTARDNRAGGGGVNRDDMTLTVSGDPFRVTYPNGGETLPAGCTITVTWDVGGGDVAASVRILLATTAEDFSTVLLASTPNDGSADVTLPCTASFYSQIMVQAVGNVFFDVSDDFFEIDKVAPTITATASGGSVDDDCEFSVTFNGTITDDCSLSAADVSVAASIPAGNGAVSNLVVNKQQVDPSTVSVTGSVLVSDLTVGDAAVRIRFTAEDNCGDVKIEDAFAAVTDDTPPVITCPADTTVECSSPNGTPADDPQLAPFFAGVSAVDNCDSDVHLSNDAPSFFDLGETSVKFSAVDNFTNVSDCTARVTVVDTTPPTIDVTLDRYDLWPANHKLSTINATVLVTDVCDPNPTFVLTSITSDEPDNGLGDGDTPVDIQNADFNTADIQFELRSERAAGGDGRTYTIIYTATDASNNTTLDTVYVNVPHDQSGKANSSSGFAGNGQSLRSDWTTFGLLIPSAAGFDSKEIETGSIEIGDHLGTLAAVSSQVADINGDGLEDLVAFFDSGRALDLMAMLDEGVTWPVGLRYVTRDGTGYWVPDILALGAPIESGVSGVEEGDAAEPLNQPRPNPFRGATSLWYSVPSSAPVEITVYNVAGQPIRTLVNQVQSEGRHMATWDGRDESGVQAPNGIYFIRGAAGSAVISARVALVRK